MKKLAFFVECCIAVAIFIGCGPIIPVKREIRTVDQMSSLNPENKYIKAHMDDGSVYILHDWEYKSENEMLVGYGVWLDMNRKEIENRTVDTYKGKLTLPFEIPLQSIALVETNDVGRSFNTGLKVMTGVTAAMGVYCLINPKACFGSCPTFYAERDDSLVLLAEGFSSSVCPELERTDIDMLWRVDVKKDFSLKVTNEALETHSIKSADILVFNVEADNQVFATDDGRFYKCSALIEPVFARSESGDCLSEVRYPDGREYYSLAEAKNLNSKEELVLHFPDVNPEQKYGLVIGMRQTLLTTFIMYQGLAYMGKSAGYWLVNTKWDQLSEKPNVLSLLGEVEILSQHRSGSWIEQGSIHETGPIATDFKIVPLENLSDDSCIVKLKMNKGLWRVDYAALVSIGEEVEPMVVEPWKVDRIVGTVDTPLDCLLNDDQYLVTYPGDSYVIHYDLPTEEAVLFLRSRGYYLEWIRDEWVKEQNFMKLGLFVNRPERYLKRAAKPYKRLEPSMEEIFWNSRYEK